MHLLVCEAVSSLPNSHSTRIAPLYVLFESIACKPGIAGKSSTASAPTMRATEVPSNLEGASATFENEGTPCIEYQNSQIVPSSDTTVKP